jgi:hypothetical protein
MKYKILILLVLMQILSGCRQKTTTGFYEGFKNPPAEARPFVRWWWNGNRITGDEIKRQLDVLQNAGIGGVEINPIAFPEWNDTLNTRSLTWLSPEWNSMLALASGEAAARGMITDLIVGSGWPFGGEFLRPDETVQRVITHAIPCTGGDQIDETLESLLAKALAVQSRPPEGATLSNEIMFVCLVPDSVTSTSQITDLAGEVSGNSLSKTIPEGSYTLVYGILQKGHRHVQNGAQGAAGPVMDHYRREVTMAYLNRLKKISDDTGIPLSKLIRALFCDSIELAGANWSDDFDRIFRKSYGYELKPWLPFIFYESYRGYTRETLNGEFSDKVSRVRYDYNKLLVRVFLDNFTKVFQEFCDDNGLLCRYQAYGTPYLMGMMEGNMIPDIPESNNWIYSVDMETDNWIWNQDHGYMIWNLYAASGGHLKGRKIISCEAMTNTRGVFKASLEEIKRHDDMNFITGINHTILHGYNYSPVEAGFPGWIRFGAYFSEQNSWWPWFSKWTNYNARLSYIFQQSQPVKNIAIMGPTGDIWSERGLIRVPFHKEPWYCYRLWESLSQAGSSCDYIDENIIADARKDNGILKYGPMGYQALIICGARSLEPETVYAIRDFIASGGKVVFTGGLPERSLNYNNASQNDMKVKEVIDDIFQKYTDRIFVEEEPAKAEDLLDWTNGLLQRINIEKDLEIRAPDKNLFQIRHREGERDIWFFVNSNMSEPVRTEVRFPSGSKTPWKWDPETGERERIPFIKSPDELLINLRPLQSLLIVFEPAAESESALAEGTSESDTALVIKGPWSAEFAHINGNRFTRSFDELWQFGTSDDTGLNTFAGTVNYFTEFESDGTGKYLSLGKLNKGVAVIKLNGLSAGTCWYGQPSFPIDKLIQPGTNRLEIIYTTVLSNYVRTLKDNPTAVRWTEGYKPIPSGLSGDVLIYK